MSLSVKAIRRPVTTIAATLALVLFGLVSLRQLPIALLPDITLPVLTIRAVNPGASAEEISRFLAEPIEQAVGATPGVSELRSVSRQGEVTTTIKFEWGTDMPRTVLQVRERLDNIRGNLPVRPTLLTSDPGQRPIAVLALTGSGDFRSIAETARDLFARQLEQVDGVASVAVVGDPGDEIRVDLDTERARLLEVTPDMVAAAINSGNAMATSGTIRRGQYRFPVRPLTELTSPAEILDIPIQLPKGERLRLGEIAQVTPASSDPLTMVRLDGSPALGLVVYKDGGSNTVDVTARLMETLATMRQLYPDINIQVVAAQAGFVENALSNLLQEIWAGGFLSIMVILLILRDWRLSLAIGAIVPLSVFISLTLLQLFHVSINILSLGGLALAVGMLVDNAIVVAEATVRFRADGLSLVAAAEAAVDEIGAPLIAGTLTTVLVFGPIVFVRGLAAALFRDLSLAVVVTMLASLVLALTLMPVMSTWGRRKRVNGQAERRFKLLDRLGEAGFRWYESGMRLALNHPWKTVGLFAAGTAVTIVILINLPREILPQVDEGMAVINLQLPAGTAIEETSRQVARIETRARELGSSGVYSRIGAATDEEVLSGAEPGSGNTAVLIVPTPRGSSSQQFVEAMRQGLPDLVSGGEATLSFDLAGQSEFGSLIGRAGRLVQVEVGSSVADPVAARSAAAMIRNVMDTLPMLRDVGFSYEETQPAIEVGLQRERMARYGVSPSQVANLLKGALGGVAAQDLKETGRRTPIRVRYTGRDNEDLNTALNATINGVPVGEFITVREVQVPIALVRVNQTEVTLVEGAVESGGTSAATKAALRAVESLNLPSGTTWQVTGADAEQRRTTRELGIVAFLSVALMFLVLAGEFGSFTTPLIVMTTVPLAGAGGVVVLWLMGQSLNAVSLIGIIVMIGLADNEAVVKLDAIRRYREEGYPIDEAILLGGHNRLRAITMTSLTTITGVLPLVFNWGSGGELYQPLAAGVIGGSVTALLVTFFLLPALYALVERHKEALRSRLEQR